MTSIYIAQRGCLAQLLSEILPSLAHIDIKYTFLGHRHS